MIAQYVQDNHRNWDEYLPELSFAVNTSKHESTGFSPAILNFGRELKVPHEFLNTPAADTPVEDINIRQERMRMLFQMVQINLQKASQTQARYYNLRRRAWKPSIGEQVYKKTRVLSSGAQFFTEKLAPRYDGPYEVVKYISPVIVILKDKTNQKRKSMGVRAHIRDLKGHQHGHTLEEQATTAATTMKKQKKPTSTLYQPTDYKVSKHTIHNCFLPKLKVNTDTRLIIKITPPSTATLKGSPKKKLIKITNNMSDQVNTHNKTPNSPRFDRLSSLERARENTTSTNATAPKKGRKRPLPTTTHTDPCLRQPTRPTKLNSKQAEPTFFMEMKAKPQKPRHDLTMARRIHPKEEEKVKMAKVRQQREASQQKWSQTKTNTVGKTVTPIPGCSTQPTTEPRCTTQNCVPASSAHQHQPIAVACVYQKSATTNTPPAAVAVTEQKQKNTVPLDPFKGITLKGKHHHRTFFIIRPWGRISVRMNKNNTQASLKFRNKIKIININN